MINSINAFIKVKKWDGCNKYLSKLVKEEPFRSKFLYVTQLRNYKEITPLLIP